MRKVDPPSLIAPPNAYYIPHHPVIRQTSQTMRLRVVFNASSRTSNSKSLNQHLHSGPKLQQDLIAILIRWRQFQYVYAADIEKMYRQILVHPHDVDFQRILWHGSPSAPIDEYQLLTVTYGTTPAPYLALRVLRQLIEDEGSSYPDAVQVLSYQAYVDDFLFGSDDLTSLRLIHNQTIQLLQKGGFSLCKCASNDSRLLSDIDEANHGLAVSKSLQVDENISVLGLTWNSVTDQFQFHALTPGNQITTKREMFSSIAKLFDPMSWVAPFVVLANILLQQLWSLKCDWDDTVPPDYLQEWRLFCSEFAEFHSLTIPQKTSPRVITTQSLHGFSDASTKAYAAVVYLRSVLEDGTVSSALLMAKTRVAPVKTVSVPRLELCAALLLARLIKFIQTSLMNRPMDCHCWSDSQITLTWVNQSPSRWKTFVANRVAKIQTLVPQSTWHHVPTDHNPADCASRGISLSELKSHRLWWSGPQWLRKNPQEWRHSGYVTAPDASKEERGQTIKILTATATPWELEQRYSSWPKLLRVTAYVKRFIDNL
ncbi:uncharacterized protein LOC143342783 [Colletes latitarsis]|uniref:uncharacterized protein LOC143342783 n=1 Tax=Colletes latitarsis TaxID=2605962 RepID=UPI004035893B